MLQDNVWPCSFKKAVRFRTLSPQCVEMTGWFDVPIPIFDPRSVCIASAEWALRMAIFPFLLCDLMIAVDIHEVFYVVIWLSARSFDPLGRLDSRRRWRSSLVRTSTWVSKRIVLQISPGGWGKTDIGLLLSTVLWMDGRTDAADEPHLGILCCPGVVPPHMGTIGSILLISPDVNGSKIYTHWSCIGALCGPGASPPQNDWRLARYASIATWVCLYNSITWTIKSQSSLKLYGWVTIF